MKRVLLVDDDVLELIRCSEVAIQTYPAPEEGGLQEEDFEKIFCALGLELPGEQGTASTEIHTLFTCGKVGASLGHSGDPTKVHYNQGGRPTLDVYYEVQAEKEELGKGSFGVVRPALHKSSETRCAMKFINKAAAGRQYIENFIELDEYTVLLKMTRQEPHPCVLKQFDYLEGAKVVYNAMELLEGLDLFRHLHE
jgi:hypothetical protein